MDLVINSDLKKLFNWSDGSFMIHFLGNDGNKINNFVNSSQGISNIEAYPTFKIYQIVFEKNIQENINLAVGLYDINSEFDVRENSSIFINPSHGVGDELAKSGLNDPSIFPNTSLGLRLKCELDEEKKLLIALLDGVPGNPDNPEGKQIIFDKDDGIFSIAEYQLNFDESTFCIGGWFYSKDQINYLIQNQLEKNYGFYLSSDINNLFSNKNIGGFLRIGFANQSTNPVGFYLGSGIRFKNPFPKLNITDLGLAFAYIKNSDSFRNYLINNEVYLCYSELNIEFTFVISLTNWFSIQPDFQFIKTPAYCTLYKNNFVSGTRFLIKI